MSRTRALSTSSLYRSHALSLIESLLEAGQADEFIAWYHSFLLEVRLLVLKS